MTGSSSAGSHRHAAGEALRVEDLEERREAVRMTVVRRGGQKEPVLETPGDLAHGLRELTVDGVARAARRCGVVRLVEDQQGARPELAQQVAQACDIGLVGEQAMRDDEARAG